MSLATGSGDGADERVAGAADDSCRDLLDERRLGRDGFCELEDRPSRAAMAWSRARRCFFSSARMCGISKVGSPELREIFRENADRSSERKFLFRFPNKRGKFREKRGFDTVRACRKRTRAGLVVRN